ncbi:MAG: four helix bundle protein [Bacteroidota bacterium]
MKQENILKDKSYKFSVRIVKFYKFFSGQKNEYVISKQILRSGTSIGAMVEEANQAESKADFIHKLSIANKEANETHYWLRLIKDTQLVSEDTLPLQNDCEELIKLLTAIIKSSKRNISK